MRVVLSVCVHDYPFFLDYGLFKVEYADSRINYSRDREMSELPSKIRED